jgi:hypothetical protein
MTGFMMAGGLNRAEIMDEVDVGNQVDEVGQFERHQVPQAHGTDWYPGGIDDGQQSHVAADHLFRCLGNGR